MNKDIKQLAKYLAGKIESAKDEILAVFNEEITEDLDDLDMDDEEPEEEEIEDEEPEEAEEETDDPFGELLDDEEEKPKAKGKAYKGKRQVESQPEETEEEPKTGIIGTVKKGLFGSGDKKKKGK